MPRPAPDRLAKAFTPTLAVALRETIDGALVLGDSHVQLHPSSRATRLVSSDASSAQPAFLHVSIPKKLKKAKQDDVRAALHRYFRDGIHIRGARYAFLGFTESTLKAGRIIFFCESERWTRAALLSSLGDVLSVYHQFGYPKFAARLGMSFSDTVDGIEVKRQYARLLEDSTAEDGHLTTDGCGIICDTTAQQMCQRMSLPPSTTVFQIRWGGVKGLLVRYPDALFDKMCTPPGQVPRKYRYRIAYRPSMLKYAGGPTILEINDVSHPPFSARLNRFFIVHLLTLGIELSVFQEKVEEQLTRLRSLTHDRMIALSYIRGELDSEGNAFYQDLYEMLVAGQNLTEPYVALQLRRFQRTQYEALRNRLSIPVKDSCYLYGVVDELGVLGENEVYINLPEQNGVQVKRILVGRNPAYAPGDLRIVEAVHKPELAHLTNCIVFPKRGRRSISNDCAGGDLDGDLYWACWDPRLMPRIAEEPLPRTPKPPKPQLTEVTEAKMLTRRQHAEMDDAALNAFMAHHYSPKLGMMVNEWQKVVEASPKGSNSLKARAMAPLIESMLDVAKSGEDVNALLRTFREVSRRKYPDDAIPACWRPPIEVLREMIPATPKDKEAMESFQVDPQLDVQAQNPRLWERYYDEARQIMPEYNARLAKAIQEDIAAASAEEEDDRKPRNFTGERKESCSDAVNREFREKYFPGGTFDELSNEALKASAWLVCSYAYRKQAFGWIPARILNTIKSVATNGGKHVLTVGALSRQASVDSQSSAGTTLVGDVHRAAGPSKHEAILSAIQEGLLDPPPIPQSSAKPYTSRATAVPPRSSRSVSGSSEYFTDAPEAVPSQVSKAGSSRRVSELSEDSYWHEYDDDRDVDSSELLVPVSVTEYPKPREPVATRLPICVRVEEGHHWLLTANAAHRRYACSACKFVVKEYKKDGYWCDEASRIVPSKSKKKAPSLSSSDRYRDDDDSRLSLKSLFVDDTDDAQAGPSPSPAPLTSCTRGHSYLLERKKPERVYKCRECHHWRS